VFAYDANGNQISVMDANGNTTTFTYDALGRRCQTTFADGTSATIGYDNVGRKISDTDQADLTTQYEYDALGRLIYVTDALGGQTDYDYDEMGNKISQTDPNGNTTTWAYDNLGRVIKHILPLGMTATMTYDARGNMVSKTDFNGDTIQYTYDVNNRLVQKTYPDSTAVNFTYTPNGQRETVTDARGVTLHSYDLRNRLLKVTNPDGTSLSYTYDLRGNRLSVTVPSGVTLYTFDALNRLATVTDPDGGVTTYAYGAVGNRAGVAYPNGTEAVYTYDSLNRLVYLENKKSTGEIISSYAYTLGPAGNRARVVEDTGRTVDYTYDGLYRLVQENITDAAVGNETISYTYDAFGNRLTKIDSSGMISYTYDENDRLLTEVGPDYTNSYDYDDNGNTTRRSGGPDTTDYIYDHENRLIQATTGATQVDYFYDPDGIRVASSTNGVNTTYLVDKNRDYAQVLEEWQGSALAGTYIYGDDLISQEIDGLKSYFHYDGLGSTRGLSDGTAALTDTFTYEAFGNLNSSTGNTDTKYLFAGEQYDPDLGLYYLRARLLDSGIGRFLTKDLFNGLVSDPTSLNAYGYARSNPVNYHDPSGQFALYIATVAALQLYPNAVSGYALHATVWGKWAERQGFLFTQGGIFVQGGYVTFPFGHLCLRIVPADQIKWGNVGPFTQRDRNNKFYATLGAYPSRTVGGLLVSTFNHDGDINRSVQDSLRLDIGWSIEGQNRLIEKILFAELKFDTNLRYWFAGGGLPFGEEYNSNSFISGLIDVIGIQKPTLFYNSIYPGYNHPVPGSAFGM